MTNFHELMGDLGIIKLQYEFIELSINGENKGLYVLLRKVLAKRLKETIGEMVQFLE